MRRVLAGFVVVAAVLALPLPGARAAPDPTWSRWFPFQATGLAAAPGGTVVVVGNSTDDYPGGRNLMRAFRSRGTLAWASSWKPAGAGVRAYGMDASAAGIFTSGVIALPEGGEVGIFGWFVRRATGSTWLRTPAGWREGASTGGGPIGAGGGVVAIGTTQYIEGYQDIHGVVRGFDASGRKLWINGFEPFPVPGAHGYDADDVTAVAVDTHGRTYAAGWAWRDAEEGANDHEAALMALDRDGSRRWVRVLGEPGSPAQGDNDKGSDVEVRDDHVMFGAVLDRQDAPSVARIFAYTSGGRVRWTRGFPTSMSWWKSSVEVVPGANGVAYVAIIRPVTHDHDDLVIRKLGSDGHTIWSRRLSSTAGLVDIAVGSGDLYVLSHHRLWRFPA